LPARILVVDDDPLAGELICEILRSAGMDASFLTSSTEAADRLKREKYHAVFLDMRMPAPDGAELARQVRASRVNASAVIVMITGEQDRTVMGRAFEAGVEFFLFKPVERNKLLKTDPCYGRFHRARKAPLHARSPALQSLDGNRQ
jgi:PleD family two-component response regulator